MIWSDHVVSALYQVAIVAFGGQFGSAKGSLKGFFLSGRTIPWRAASCSEIANRVGDAGLIEAPSQAFVLEWTDLQVRLVWPIAIVVPCAPFLPFFHKALTATPGTLSVDGLASRFTAPESSNAQALCTATGAY